MSFNIIMPLLYEGVGFLKRLVMRLKDRKCRKSGTSCTSYMEYIELYSGPDYLIHFKYALQMNIIFVTLMFGTAIPLLFPVAFLSFIIIYFLETFALFRIYRKPIDISVHLHSHVLSYIQFGAVISLSFSFWQLSNL